jgi:hypothetical protein
LAKQEDLKPIVTSIVNVSFAPKNPKPLDHYESDSTFSFSLVDRSDCSKINFNVVNFTPARLVKNIIEANNKLLA